MVSFQTSQFLILTSAFKTMDTWITITQDDILASINNPELTAALNTAPASGQYNTS